MTTKVRTTSIFGLEIAITRPKQLGNHGGSQNVSQLVRRLE
jgi:hypothetical protein